MYVFQSKFNPGSETLHLHHQLEKIKVQLYYNNLI